MRRWLGSSSGWWVLAGVLLGIVSWSLIPALPRELRVVAYFGAPVLVGLGLLLELARRAPRRRAASRWRLPLVLALLVLTPSDELVYRPDVWLERLLRWHGLLYTVWWVGPAGALAWLYVRFERARDGMGMARVAIGLAALRYLNDRHAAMSTNCFGPITPAHTAGWPIAESSEQRAAWIAVAVALLIGAFRVQRWGARRLVVGGLVLLGCVRLAQEVVTNVVANEVARGQATRAFVEGWAPIADAVDGVGLAVIGALVALLVLGARMSRWVRRDVRLAWALVPAGLALALLGSPRLLTSMIVSTVQQDPEPFWEDVPGLEPIELPDDVGSGAYLFIESESSVSAVLDPSGPIHVYRGGRSRALRPGETLHASGRLFWGGHVEVIFDRSATLGDARRAMAAMYRYPGIRITGYGNHIHGVSAGIEDRWPFVGIAAREMRGVYLTRPEGIYPHTCIRRALEVDGEVAVEGECDERAVAVSVDALPDETPLRSVLSLGELVANVKTVPAPLVRTEARRKSTRRPLATTSVRAHEGLTMLAAGALSVASLFGLWVIAMLVRFAWMARGARSEPAPEGDDAPIWPPWARERDATHRWVQPDPRGGPFRAGTRTRFRGPPTLTRALLSLLPRHRRGD